MGDCGDEGREPDGDSAGRVFYEDERRELFNSRTRRLTRMLLGFAGGSRLFECLLNFTLRMQ